MDFSETGLPEVGAIQQESRLLELAEEWRRLILWDKFSEHREDIRRVVYAIRSYLYWFEQVFSREIDFFHLRGQDNLLRFSPIENLVIRLDEQDSLFDTLARIAAASISGCTYRVSVPPDMANDSTTLLAGRYGKQLLQGAELYRQDDAQLISALPNTGRLRYGGPGRVPEAVFAATSKTGLYISRTPVYMEGRLELLQYFQQQSVCNNYHRYGNLGDRSLD
jgi:RHH-type proline utilization regulon transcriptional repressor/proline dehydrogenase/delta 1-pyrroline-5-carboxylate dehydrogenase